MQVFLAQNDVEVKCLLERFGGEPSHWIAKSPSAMYELDKQGIGYHTPDDYCTLSEVARACQAKYDELTAICRRCDHYLLDQMSPFPEHGIKPFMFNLFLLSRILDVLIRDAFQLNAILNHHNKDSIYCFSSGLPRAVDLPNGIPLWTNIYGELLRCTGLTSKKIVLLPENECDLIREKIKQLKSIKRVLNGRHNNFYWAKARVFLRSLKWDGGLALRAFFPGTLSAPRVCLLNGDYEWGRYLKGLRDLKITTLRVSESDLETLEDRRGTRSVPAETIQTILGYFDQLNQGIPMEISNFMQPLVGHITQTFQPKTEAVIRLLDSLFRRKPPKVLLTAVGTNYGYFVAKRYFQNRQVPVISWQHGAEWGNGRVTQRNDLLNAMCCDKLFVYGEKVAEAYENSRLPECQDCDIVPVGMESLERINKISVPRGRGGLTVVWPFGGYYGNQWYCGFDPPHNDRTYYREQRIILSRLVQLMAEHSRFSIIIKLYSGLNTESAPPWVHEAVGNPQITIAEGSQKLVDLLENCHGVIIDSPTTTLLQAMATTLPVFVLTSVIGWPEDAVQQISRRAVVAPHARQLMDHFSRFVATGNYEADLENDDFLCNYGTHKGDAGQLVEEAMKIYLHDGAC